MNFKLFAESLPERNMRGKDWSDIVAEVLEPRKPANLPEAYVESFDGRNLSLNLCMENLQFQH